MSAWAFVIGCFYGSVWTLIVVRVSRRGWLSDLRALVRPRFTSLTVSDAGSMKIQSIKAIRAATGLGLREAKDASEGVALVLGRADAAVLVTNLRAIGVTVEARPVRKSA